LARLCDIMGLPIEANEQDRLIKMDTDGSGSLDLDEWITWWVKRSSTLPNPAKQQEVIARNTYEKYDADGSGSIDITELTKLLEDIGGSFSPKELNDAMNELDKDGNGILDQEEFVDWWCNRCLAGRKSGGSLIALKLKKLAKKASRIFSTDIHTAAWQGDAKLVSAFLKSDARLSNASDSSEYGDNWTVLHYAAYRGHIKIVEELLDCRANVNSVNNEGFSPLFYAAQQGHIDICKLLLEKGCDPTICGVASAGNNHFYPGVIMSCMEHSVDTPALKELFENNPKCRGSKVTVTRAASVSNITTALTPTGVLSITGLPSPTSLSRDLFLKCWRIKVINGGDDDACRVFDVRIKHIPSEEQTIELKDSAASANDPMSWVACAARKQLYLQIQVVTPMDATNPWSDTVDVSPAPVIRAKKAPSATSSTAADSKAGPEALRGLLDEVNNLEEMDAKMGAEIEPHYGAKDAPAPLVDNDSMELFPDLEDSTEKLPQEPRAPPPSKAGTGASSRTRSKGSTPRGERDADAAEFEPEPAPVPEGPSTKKKYDMYADHKATYEGENPYPFGSAAAIKWGKAKAAKEAEAEFAAAEEKASRK
jgi:Ca2+-binding EF-hand superfamily protein